MSLSVAQDGKYHQKGEEKELQICTPQQPHGCAFTPSNVTSVFPVEQYRI